MRSARPRRRTLLALKDWESCCNRLAEMRLSPSFVFLHLAASFSWLIASIRRRIRTRLPTCWSVRFGTFFRGNCKGTRHGWPLAKAMNKKIVPTLGHSTSRFNEQFLDKRSVRSELDIASASTGSLRECRSLDTTCDHSRTFHKVVAAAAPKKCPG